VLDRLERKRRARRHERSFLDQARRPWFGGPSPLPFFDNRVIGGPLSEVRVLQLSY
jgi:hypothetical protein